MIFAKMHEAFSRKVVPWYEKWYFFQGFFLGKVRMFTFKER